MVCFSDGTGRGQQEWFTLDQNYFEEGGAFVVSYSLEAVYTPDGDPTEFVENLSFAPEKMLLSR